MVDVHLPRLKASRNELRPIDERRIKRAKEASSISRPEIISAYRSLIKSYGRDPSKRKPSSERVRAMLLKGKLDVDHPAVLAYNLVSAATGIVFSGFDASKVVGSIRMGSYSGEVELMDGTILELTGKEVALMDDEKVLSVVPYMDTKYAKIDSNTREAVFVPHIVQGIPAPLALRALRRLKDILDSIGAETVIEL